MTVKAHEVTAFCPRCDRPIVWSVRPFAGGEQLQVSAFACHCALRDDEWDDLADEAGEAADRLATDDDAASDEPALRRGLEDDPA